MKKQRGTVLVPLTQGEVAIIDADDAALVSQFAWAVTRGPRGLRYAVTNGEPGQPRRTLKMHRLITGAPANVGVDHKNGNGLDNRKSNLRLATQSQNNCNQRRRLDNTTGYKGVQRNYGGRFQAVIRVNGKRKCLGTFDAVEDAARAYDDAARELHGEFARVNFEGRK